MYVYMYTCKFVPCGVQGHTHACVHVHKFTRLHVYTYIQHVYRVSSPSQKVAAIFCLINFCILNSHVTWGHFYAIQSARRVPVFTALVYVVIEDQESDGSMSRRLWGAERFSLGRSKAPGGRSSAVPRSPTVRLMMPRVTISAVLSSLSLKLSK